ncbi:MAG: Smr/MutS family protein [Bacteroidetes bacterium]|nr:Smr/MutS family protein [Bacteroidota bacterium]
MKYALLYPQNIESKLEFDKLIVHVKEHCISELGLACVDKIRISADIEFIRKTLMQVHEMKSLMEEGKAFPSQGYILLDAEIGYLSIANSVFGEEQFFMLKQFLGLMKEVFEFFEASSQPMTSSVLRTPSPKEKDKKGEGQERHQSTKLGGGKVLFFGEDLGEASVPYPALQSLLRNQVFQKELYKSIDHIISEEGVVRSGISPVLDGIRKNIKSKERELDRAFNKILSDCEKNGWLASGGESIKNGRRVVALLSEHKRKFKGIIHDESATGKAVFLEPEITLDISNEHFALKQEEKREIYRILKELTDDIRPYAEDLRFYQKLAGLFDFIRAKALFARQLKAHLPEITEDKKLFLIKAFHPLLYLHNNKLDKDTIPLEMKLDAKERILLISGPNAGGKSVALKTVGLLQMMLQAGLLVPTFPDSVFTVFNQIFVELGDEQSIDNELSTYSSKLRHMKYFLEKADHSTIFFIDEFGTGTDPKSGGAIAEAMLEKLNQKNAFGVINTHYSNLKVFATNTDGIINGSMLFDTQTLSPLYKLTIGQPGSSYAFEIATKIGLPKKVIDAARKKTEDKFQDYDALLATLETDKHYLNIRIKELDEDQKRLNALVETYSLLKEDLETNKKALLLEAKKKSAHEMDTIKQRFEKLVAEFEKKSKHAKNHESLKKEFSLQQHAIQKEITKIKEETLKKIKPEDLKPGMKVRMYDTKESGIVEEVRKDKALVSFGNMRTLMPISELEIVAQTAKENLKTRSIDLLKIAEQFSQEIDLRGYRTDEALMEVEKQLDKALLLSIHSLRILHGKGDGILRKKIREMLKKYSFVKSFASAALESGGDGITVVELE